MALKGNEVIKLLTCDIKPAGNSKEVAVVVEQADGRVIGGYIEKEKVIGSFLPVKVLQERDGETLIEWPICCGNPEFCRGDEIWVINELFC